MTRLSEQSITQLNVKIRKHEEQIQELEKAKQIVSKLSPAHILANKLHAKMCHSNHTDQCDWQYDDWEDIKNNYARKTYLSKAETILATKIPLDDIMKIIDLL